MSDIPKDWLPLFEWAKFHYSKQVEFIDALKDYWEVIFLAGNGAGKSHVLYWSLLCYAYGIHPHQIAEPPLRIKVLVNDFEHGYGKIFVETCLWDQKIGDNTIGPMLSKRMVKRYPARDDRTLELVNGSILFFQTSEQHKKLHSGTNFDILGCDEESDYWVYDESKRGLRTAKGGGKILHSFTPPFDDDSKNRGPSWTKFHLVDPFDKGEDKDVYVVRACMKDNPAITDDFIRKFSKGKSESQLKIQLYGEYPPWGELIFPEFQDYLWDSKTKMGHLLPWDFEVPWRESGVEFEMALDWHGSKPPAVIWAFEYTEGPNKGDVVVFDELSPKAGKGMTIMETSNAIREIEGWRQERIKRWGDPKMRDKNNALITGFSPWEEFRHCGIRLNEAWNREPYVGYSIMRDFLKGKGRDNLEHPRLFIKETCKTLIYNMKNHHNVQKGDGTADPDPKFSDYCVSLKYIMQRKSRKQRKAMEKSGKYSKWPMTSYGVGEQWGGTYITDWR